MVAMIGSFLCLESCVDEIELDVPRGQTEAVVVQGNLAFGEEKSQVDVIVKRIFSFDGSSTTLRVKYVELINDNDQLINLDFISEGVYRKIISIDDQFLVAIGSLYKIKLELFDGRIIESTLEALNSVDGDNRTSISIKKKPIFNIKENTLNEVDRVVIDLESDISDIQNKPRRYRWFASLTYRVRDQPSLFGQRNREQKICYVTNTFPIKEQFLFDGYDSNESSLVFKAEVFSGRLNDDRYLDTVYFNVVQESLSEGAFDYYNNIDKTLELSGSMFDPAAGKIKSNLYNVNDPDEEVFGYFHASEQISEDILVTPDFFGLSASGGCVILSTEDFAQTQCRLIGCCDCLSLQNSSLIKPDFWE